MKKFLLAVLLVAFCATSALAAGVNFSISDNGKILTIGKAVFIYTGISAVLTEDQSDTVIATRYMDGAEDSRVMVYRHRLKSRPYVFVILTKPAVDGGIPGIGAFEDFDCNDTWEAFSPNSPISVPDCARAE